MLQSLLLHLASSSQADPVIRVGIDFARETGSRIRGLALADTRRADRSHLCESALYSAIDSTRRVVSEGEQAAIHLELAKGCCAAQLRWEVRRLAGDPLMHLPQESRFHDLTITTRHDLQKPWEVHSGLPPADLLRLVHRGVQPLLVVDPSRTEIHRVLMVFDGSEASGRAIRSYLNLGVLKGAEYRLLVVGTSESNIHAALREMAGYCRQRIPAIETGCVRGTVGKVVPAYAEKWEADLVVLGIDHGNFLLDPLRRATGTRLLKSVPGCLYLTA